MATQRSEQATFREWFGAFGKYLLLIIVIAITIFLVVLAFNRPITPSFTGSLRALADIKDTERTQTPATASEPTIVAFIGGS